MKLQIIILVKVTDEIEVAFYLEFQYDNDNISLKYRLWFENTTGNMYHVFHSN